MMADIEEKALKFIWKIENYSYYVNRRDQFLQSPDFQMHVYDGLSWRLKLYPKGLFPNENFVSVHLERLPSCGGPFEIAVDYGVSILRPDLACEYVKETKNRCFRKGYSFGFDNLAVRDEILGTKRTILLPKDILTVQCRIFPKGTMLESHTEIITKTRLDIERYIFYGKIKKFSPEISPEYYTLTLHDVEKPLRLKLLWISINQVEYLKIYFFNCSDLKACHCKLHVLDCNGLTSQCILDKHMVKIEDSVSIILPNEIQKQKSLFSPNEVLTLHYDFTFSFGIQYNQIEVVALDNTIFTATETLEASSEIERGEKNHLCACADVHDSSFKNDFQTLYEEETLCDFTLKVGNENIQAHKAVLVARSPVFKAMLTSNMKESEKNSVDISDLDVNTVRCMLRFLYTDATGDLDCEEARKLYFAADKYGLTKLKRICTNVISRNVCVSNVGDVLSFANLHRDEDLKDKTIEFICRQETEVMCSTEWKEFMTEDVHLAAETMRQIFMKKAKNDKNRN